MKVLVASINHGQDRFYVQSAPVNNKPHTTVPQYQKFIWVLTDDLHNWLKDNDTDYIIYSEGMHSSWKLYIELERSKAILFKLTCL